MRRRKRTRRKSIFLFTFLTVGLLFVAVSYKNVSLDSKKDKLENQKQELETQMEDLQMESERIKEYETYVNSTEFVEDTARDKLGLVYPNEIVFKPEEE